MDRKRCAWATSESLVAYHDQEWGVPEHDDRKLFEFLILEGAQAGLSWETVLKKRRNYRTAFDAFNPEIIAGYTSEKIEALMQDSGIIRNRLKIQSTVLNAQAFLRAQREFGSFDHYLWSFVGHRPIFDPQPARQRVTHNEISDALSRDLLKRGFKFVGTTICYALMQAIGMVNDHDPECFRGREIAEAGR